MSEIKFSNFVNEDGSHGPDLVGVTTFTSPHYFVPPSGTTAQRPSGEGLAPGMLRFNTDIGRLEVWRGDHWATILGESPSLDGGARGIVFTGYTGSRSNAIEFININTTGNGQDFGDLTLDRSGIGAGGSRTRAIAAGGMGPTASPVDTNIIDYVTIASTGNAQDFGDRTTSQRDGFGLSNETRSCFGGGQAGGNNTIDYVTIASTGNAQDFGDLSFGGRGGLGGSCASSTRGVMAGGSGLSNIIEFITISTLSNTTDFGDLTIATQNLAGGSNSIRGIFAGGDSPGNTNVIHYITISTLGNAQDFGDTTTPRNSSMGTASSTRMVICGGSTPSASNTIDYVTIMQVGNAIDFGDLNVAGWTGDATSNAHGGL